MIERDPQRLEWTHERYPEVLTVIGDATLDAQPEGVRYVVGHPHQVAKLREFAQA